MKKNVLKSIVLFGGILFLSASCVKEIESKNDTYRPAGSPIVFAAETGYDNGIATRTAYSGEAFDVTVNSVTKQFERIDWVAGDKVKVCYLNTGASAVYTVGSPSSNNEQSSANLSSQTPMTWDEGDDDHVFYAMYPDVTSNSGHGTNSNASLQVSPNGALVRGVIPDEQTVYQKASGSKVYNADMVYGYLVSKKTIDAESTATSVELPFRPATTTFQFQFKTASGSAAVSSFEMSSTTSDLTGKFTFDMKDGYDTDDRVNPSWGTVSLENTTKKITVTFDQSATITSDVALDFTVFALPVDITNVTLKFNFADGTSKTLPLKREGVFDTFNACKKYIITNAKVPSNDEWTYTLVEVDATGAVIPVANIFKKGPAATDTLKRFKSYRTKVSDPTVHELLDVVIEYADTNATGGNSEIYVTTPPAWLAYAVDTDGKPETTNPTGIWSSTANLTAVPVNEPIKIIDETPEHKTLIGNNPSNTLNGHSQSKPQDLALYEINALTGSARTGNKPKTANCYVVDRKGYYQFPIVYGNAIDWDINAQTGWNPTSYTTGQGLTGWGGTGTSASHCLYTFQNYLADPIQTPYILDDVNLTAGDVEAVIVWEDVEESGQFIPASSVNVVATPNTDAVYYTNTGATKVVPYITFQVNDNIRQGNAVIALREKTGAQRIIWSWHIWLTEHSMETYHVPVHSSIATRAVESNEILRYDLGWCDTRIVRKYTYTDRKCYVRISHVSTQSDADPLVFEVKEVSDPYYTLVVSSGTYYQQGRKDPFLPGTSNEMTWANYIGDLTGYLYASRWINKDSHSPAGYTITTDAYTVNALVATSAMSNADYSIQHPYVFINADEQGASNAFGYVYGRRPHNLWNVMDYTLENHPEWQDGGGLGEYKAKEGYDIMVVKSVYDPCPPGFSIPNYTAFTGFTDKGYNPGYKNSLNGPILGSDANWIPADAEHLPDLVIDGVIIGDRRYYLELTPGDVIVFPNQGVRDNGSKNGRIDSMNNGYVATAKTKGDRYYVCFGNFGPVGAAQARSEGYPVRPARIHYDNAVYSSVVLDGQRTGGYYESGDLNNNWQ